MKIDENKVYMRALKDWGKQAQMLMVVEEMSELTKEILKNINRQKNNIAEIIEEAADVEIMLGQLKCCYGITEQIADYKEHKLEMISQRLDEWEKKEK